MQLKEINVVVPGLLSLEAYAIANLTNELDSLKLNKFLARGTLKELNYVYSDLVLANQLSNSNDSLAVSYAKSLGVYTKEGNYLLAQVTNCKAQGDKVVIWALPKDFLCHETALEYITKLNRHFAQRLEFHYINNDLWLLDSSEILNLDYHHPVIDIIGQDIDEYLPQGVDQLNYCSILNEIQMLLHDLAPAQELITTGFNTLWLWDKKLKPNLLNYGFNKIAANLDDLIIINPTINKIDSRVNIEEILKYNVVFLSDLYYPAQYHDMYEWQQNLLDLDKYLAQIIEEAFYQKDIQTCNIHIPHGNKVISLAINKNDKYKFWRRARHTLINLIKDSNEE